MLKKLIDKYNISDVPQNGIIKIIDEEGNERRTGISNLPLLFEKDIEIANYNGYYEYIEDNDEYLKDAIPEYYLEDNTIKIKWVLVESE